MPHRYDRNNSSSDRFTQLSLTLDNGQPMTLLMGSTYTLTAGERARAGQYIVLVDSDAPPEETPDPPLASGGGSVVVVQPGDEVPDASDYAEGILLAEVYEL